MRAIIPLALVALLAGCGTTLQPPRTIPATVAKASTASAPAINADKISVLLDPDHHHARIIGATGAIKGTGVWGSPGRHEKPANGEEATALPEGGFELELHAHPGETVTIWAFLDQGDRRRYSKPLVLTVPIEGLAAERHR